MVRGPATTPPLDLTSQREVVDAFLAALRGGDFEALLAVLDPDVVVRIDASAVPPGAPTEIRGARTWAREAIALARTARFVRPALVNGSVGLLWAPGGRLSRVLTFLRSSPTRTASAGWTSRSSATEPMGDERPRMPMREVALTLWDAGRPRDGRDRTDHSIRS